MAPARIGDADGGVASPLGDARIKITPDVAAGSVACGKDAAVLASRQLSHRRPDLSPPCFIGDVELDEDRIAPTTPDLLGHE